MTLDVGNAAPEMEPWAVLKTDYYQIMYRPEHVKDAKKVKSLLDAARAALKNEFSDSPVEQLLRVDCKVYLHPKPNDRASETTAAIYTAVGGDKYSAVIDLLTLSAYHPKYRSNVGEPPGEDYYAKLVVHEYSTILLDRITGIKKTGWRFFSAPRWFVDGYEEYLGLTQSSPHNRDSVLAKYLALHKQNANRIDFEFGIHVEDPYIDGAILLLFMHETFGSKRVQAILTNKEPRFGKAVTAALGVGLNEFRQSWEKWLQAK
jgi:hypothetical protein